jgi:hypothetical protein
MWIALLLAIGAMLVGATLGYLFFRWVRGR